MVPAGGATAAAATAAAIARRRERAALAVAPSADGGEARDDALAGQRLANRTGDRRIGQGDRPQRFEGRPTVAAIILVHRHR